MALRALQWDAARLKGNLPRRRRQPVVAKALVAAPGSCESGGKEDASSGRESCPAEVPEDGSEDSSPLLLLSRAALEVALGDVCGAALPLGLLSRVPGAAAAFGSRSKEQVTHQKFSTYDCGEGQG